MSASVSAGSCLGDDISFHSLMASMRERGYTCVRVKRREWNDGGKSEMNNLDLMAVVHTLTQWTKETRQKIRLTVPSRFVDLLRVRVLRLEKHMSNRT
jgi:hypothetical protein